MSIICGPIVRHSNRNELNIWIVTDSKPVAVDLRIYGSKEFKENLAEEVRDNHIQMGKRCFCYLVTAKLKATANRGDRIYYDIVLDNDGGFRETRLNLIIGFPGAELPSVLLPAMHTRLMQSSCRKPHDEECIDQLAVAAKSLFKKASADGWPSQLFLTGDQIYADDVSPLLLDYLHQMREKLGIAAEKIDGADFELGTKLDKRKDYLDESKGFTSTELDSHLLTFSEYFCMYLFSFGADIPGVSFSDYETLSRKLSRRPRTDKYDHSPGYFYGEWKYEDHLEALRKFSNQSDTGRPDTAPPEKWVRRLLANIATYMIFDDHEVTDDWNLDKEVFKNMTTGKIGKRMYVNALSAYLVCQHWGNQPGTVSATELRNAESRALDPETENGDFFEYLRNKYWGYVLDQSPPVVVLDTRTTREHSASGRRLALISPVQLRKLESKLAGFPSSRTAIVISPTPVYGFTNLEAVQLKFPALKQVLDREPWIANEAAFKQLHTALRGIPEVRNIVIFSGDVHYAFMRLHEAHDQKVADGKTITDKVSFWQLCSSASCNTPSGKHTGLPFFDRLMNKITENFGRKFTKYLQPEDEGSFLTSHKNVSTLILDDGMTPITAVLHCSEPKPGKKYREYERFYDLTRPRQIPRE